MSRGETPGAELITGDQLREAERGFIAMLRAKRFPATWIDRNAIDLLAQASSEYAVWLKRHEPEANPVGWLITCAYRRALNLLDSQRLRPQTTSIEGAFDLADEATPTPEQKALDNDRQRRLREVLGCLSSRDRRLISLVYFEGHSVREAGRHLGWRKSSADRRHRAALDRLRSIVGEDRSLLSPASLGLAAWAAVAGDRGSGLLRRLGDGVRRLAPFAEPGGVALSGGAGRVVGVCGAGLAAAACGLLATGVYPGLSGVGDSPQRAPLHHATPEPAQERVVLAPPPLPSTTGKDRGASPRRGGPDARRRERTVTGAQSPRSTDRPVSAATPEAVAEDFGVEGGLPEEPPAEKQGSLPASNGASESPSNAGSRPHEATGTQVSEEFGL